jgi:hypothetical protein
MFYMRETECKRDHCIENISHRGHADNAAGAYFISNHHSRGNLKTMHSPCRFIGESNCQSGKKEDESQNAKHRSRIYLRTRALIFEEGYKALGLCKRAQNIAYSQIEISRVPPCNTKISDRIIYRRTKTV